MAKPIGCEGIGGERCWGADGQCAFVGRGWARGFYYEIVDRLYPVSQCPVGHIPDLNIAARGWAKQVVTSGRRRGGGESGLAKHIW